MEKLSGSAPKTLTPAELESPSNGSTSSLPLGEAATITNELVAGFEMVAEPGTTTDVLVENAAALDRTARFTGHLFGEHNVAQNLGERIEFAVVRTAGEELVQEGFGSLRSGPPTRRSVTSAIISAANGTIDVNSDLRIATQVVAEVQPTAPLDGAVGLAIDVMSSVTHGEGTRIAELEAVNTRALGGEYGAPTQAVSMVSNLATDFHGTSERLTGEGAENGDYGVFVRVGNEIGDNLFETSFGRYESEWEFRAD